MPTALVTGGTSGIGYAFCRHLASQGHDLVVVARNIERLNQVRDELSERFSHRVEILQADLNDRADLDAVIDRLTDPDRPVDVVVNDAGFGLNQSLLDPDIDLQARAMNVMCFAVLALSGAAGRVMRQRGHGIIINVSSVSAWIIKGNYSAIKRWVLTYTQALAAELEGTGVQATAVCPSWVKTDLHRRAGVKRPKLPSWAWVSPEQVASCALEAAERGRVVAIPTLKWRIAAAFLNYAPAAIPRKISKMIVKSRGKQHG